MATTPKDVRAGELDATDRELLRLLQSDARMPNSELAQRVGIAASTCHGRLRRLVDLGIIRGFFADVDPAALGRDLGYAAEFGYTVRSVRGFDAFPMTHHVETIVILEPADVVH